VNDFGLTTDPNEVKIKPDWFAGLPPQNKWQATQVGQTP